MPELRPLLSPPESEAQLLSQARQLSGYALGELAAMAGIVTPKDLKRDKGWIGVLLEIWLGASAGSKPEQDFAAAGRGAENDPCGQSWQTAGNHLCVCGAVNRQYRRHLGNQPCTAQTQTCSVDPGRRRTQHPSG